jgi:chemotaxis-related protein WspB
MLYLMCYADDQRFALPVKDVQELTARVHLARAAGNPDWMAGLLNYRGRPVPVLDLAQLAIGRPTQTRYSTRIILLLAPGRTGELFGLLAERVTTAALRADQVRPTNAALGSQILFDEEGLVQLLDPDRLLPPDRRDILFPPAELTASQTADG